MGTNHDRPSRTGGAGSDTTRPATDANAWPGVRTMVCVFVETARPPASVSSRAVRSNSFARSSSANISWPFKTRAGSGRRASRDSTV